MKHKPAIMSLQPPPSIKRDSYRANTEHIPNTNLQSRRPEPIHINNQTFPIPPSSTISRLSATTAFNTGIDHRDGVSCVICNCEIRQCLEHAHIIERSRPDIWQWLKEEACCIPWNARGVEHECRNGILLCRNHHAAFDAHYLYIRWINERNSHVFVNHSKSLSLIQFHDCNIRLDPDDPRAPWPVLFAYHEGLVRARFPWPSPCISFPKVITKVVSTVGLTKSSKRDSDSFMNSEQTPKRPRYHGMHNESEAPQARSQAHTTTLYALSSSKPTLPEVQHQVIKVGDDEDYYEDWHTSVSQSSATMPISEAVNYPKKPETNPVPYHGLPQLRPQVLQPFKFDSTEHLRRYFGEDEMKEQGFRNWYLPVEDEE